ncbi:hypothetical protein ACJVC5_03405 [Peredibacter sp. HCB2-198]|uniref:hypothetical protein n=1 Tax=Peredibacter sp. HCB2-198 TaxID=3383025 RepID=UPI0038B698BD
MFNFWSLTEKYLGFRQLTVCSMLLCAGFAKGQTASLQNRMPASYVPDDDVIVAPVDNELSFYQQYVASDKSEDVVISRNQIKVWNDNQAFADQYGLDSTLAGSTFFVPTPDEKYEYFKDKYMRYLRRKGEQPLKDTPKNWYNAYRASNEVDTIDEMEARFKSTTKKSHTGKDLPEAFQEKEVSIWKQTKFIFQPRLDQGLVIVGFKSPIAYTRAWVGANGETEINVQKSVDSIGFRVMFNYYAHSGKYFTSADQRIMDNLYARVTSQKNPDANTKNDEIRQDNTVMLLYAKQF